MKHSLFTRFRKDENAAIAPMYAIAIFGLIAIAGVGWDYGRLMTMDSELQNAADQAALAAATQLDGRDGAMQRARDAATNFLASSDSQWANRTRMANDGQGRTISGLTFRFYDSYDSEEDTFGTEITADSDADEARVVSVTVNGREAFYALTPIVGAISSGPINANAVAGLQSATCNVPPLMVCAPDGDDAWPTAEDIGAAVDMREGPQNSSDFTPGNFDLLDIDYDNIANNEQNRTLGLNSDLLGCNGDQLETAPGRRTPQSTAINTRFGIYPNGNNFACEQGSKDYCPAQVTRNNLVLRKTVQNQFSSATCANTSGGELVPYTEVPATPAVPPQGFPLDTCQSLGLAGCLSFGDGDWPVDTYLNDIHGTTSASVPGLDADGDGRITRYEVYEWERADSSRTQQRQLAKVPNSNGQGGTLYCSAPLPTVGTPVAPSDTQKDRRIVTVAVVDCVGQGGRFDVNSFKFVDMFLLSPMTGASGSRELRAEVIGPARRADGGTGFQYFGRNKPVLLR